MGSHWSHWKVQSSLWKMNVFPYISWETPHMCVETLRTGLFFWDNRFEGSYALVYSKNEHFPMYLLWNPINVYWNHQNMAHFSKTIDLSGYMPRFTWKINIFPSISLEIPYMCVETLRTGLLFLQWSIWGVTCLCLLEKWMFSHLSPLKPHKCVLKPSEWGLIFQDDRFEGSYA